MTDPIFVEQHFDDVWHHWKYQFYCDDFSRSQSEEMWQWCMDNLGATCTWHVRWNGVIIYYEDLAMAFKLTWM